MTPPSTPPDRPSLSQAFGLIAAAILLLTSTCFSVFGIGSVNTGGSVEVLVPLVLVVALGGLIGLLVGVGVLIGRLFRRAPTDLAPRHSGGLLDPPAPPRRPTFAQGALLLIAGTITYSSTCFAVVGTGRGARLGLFTTMFFVAGLAAALWGVGTMVIRVLGAWRSPRRTSTTASDASGASDTTRGEQ